MDIIADRLDALVCHKCNAHISLKDREPFTELECPECGTKQPVPLRFGDFFLLKELGKGGMGAVYKALDKTLGRYVAIKVMRKEMGDDSKALQDFLGEARAAAALNHPNIVQIYSCGQEKGQPYIVMEMVGGGRLDKQVDAGEILEEARLLEVARDVAHGLEAANQIGLIHGDIKPANILFGHDGKAKVVDFGLARFVASQQAPGEIWGTPFYVAPEKVRRQPEDLRSDIYSLGATLYHALAGKPPFDGDTAADVVLAPRLDNAAPDVREIRNEVHPETSTLLSRMLEEDPARRYPTYKSLLPDLNRAIEAVKAGPVPLDERPRAKRKMIAAAVVLLLIVGGIAGALYMQNREEPAPEPERTPVKYRFVNGKLVPVYADEVGSVDEMAGEVEPAEAEGEATAPPAEPPPVQPFSAGEDERFSASLADAAAGGLQMTLNALDGFHDELPETHTGRHWVRAAQALAAWLNSNDAAFRLYADGVKQTAFNPEHPAAFSQTLVLFMEGAIAQGVLEERAAGGPGWHAALADLVTGVSALRQNRPVEARGALSAYIARSPEQDVTWVQALTPLAQHLVGMAGRWDAVRTSVDRKLEAGDPQSALNEVDAFRSRAPAGLLPHVNALAAKARTEVATKAAADAEAAAAARAAHRDAVQRDLDAIDEARAQVLPLVARLEFDEAARRMRAARSGLETAEGRAWLAVVKEGYDRMEALKDFLVDAIQANPFGRAMGNALPGVVIGATDRGLAISLGGESDMVKAWNQVGPRLFVQLARRYIASSDLGHEKRATLLADAAIFSYENGMSQPAAIFARQAVEADPGLAAVIDTAMPGLLGS